MLLIRIVTHLRSQLRFIIRKSVWMSYRLAWDDFSVLLHLWACKNRESSERLTLHRPTYEISDRGGVCRFFILELWYVILFWWSDIALHIMYLPSTAPWAFDCFHWCMEVVLHVEVLDHHHCTVSVHKIFWISDSECIQGIVGCLFFSSWLHPDFVQLAVLIQVRAAKWCSKVHVVFVKETLQPPYTC